MQTTHSADQRLWKRCLQDALFEMDPQALREKLKAAEKAIEIRRLQLNSNGNSDSLELTELIDGLHTIRAFDFLKESNGAVGHR